MNNRRRLVVAIGASAFTWPLFRIWLPKRRNDAVVVPEFAMFIDNTNAIMNIAAKRRLPSIGFKEFADAGGLIGYGVNFLELFHRAAYFVDKIFKGAKPSDIPVERPTRFELVVNLKTAKNLGITIPQSVLIRADKVIQ